MSQSVASYLLERLQAWDVEKIFAFPGDGINGILGAWAKAESSPQFIQARHEEMAAFEAVGYAKFSGQIGVCMATSGPGAIHLLNGLYDAKLDHVPVLAIVGQTDRTAMGGSYQQEVDLASLFKDVCHQYVETLTVPQQLPNLIDRAIRTAPVHPLTDLHHRPLRRPRARIRATGARLQNGALEPGDQLAAYHTRRREHPPGGRDPQRRVQGRHFGRPRRPWGTRRDHRGSRNPRSRSGQGALGERRAVR